MCRAGGPRCKGSGGRNTKVAAGGATATATVEKLGVPSREDADRLAAALPADRRSRLTGELLSDRDRRFFALRESGYTGPTDKDGYPDTSSDGAATLRRMAQDRGETVNW